MGEEGLNFWISYFYNIRFLPPDIVPISTAVYDPSWYKGEKEDKRGVLCGIRFEEFHHPCPENCGCPCEIKKPDECRFLKEYRSHLFSLNWDILMTKFIELQNYLNNLGHRTTGYCLMVYEKPDNPCSERGPLIELFRRHGIELKEWER